MSHVASTNVAASTEFYTGLLGFNVAMDMGWIVTFVSPSNPTAQISVVTPDAPARPDISVEVEDVDAVHALALSRGEDIVYPLTEEPWGVRRFFVRDPNGAVINVLQHVQQG